MTKLSREVFKKAALVMIDLQSGIFARNPNLEPYTVEDIIRRNVDLAQVFSENKLPVALVTVGRPNFTEEERAIFSTIVPELEVFLKTDKVETFMKYEPSAMSIVELKDWLQKEGVETIFLSGVVTSNGVAATADDAHQAGYQLIIIEDAMSSKSSADHYQYIEQHFPEYAKIVTTEDVIESI
ncbi:cysteine hydrolase [Listeria sp. PSOL-1]|uniref:cysteine hydrolase n=1 Tax=Listeria sp. PSOL-1 TaxID=1844999 RepID=UPI0013D82F5B|nr:cysteine hydrolase [Listeria sp. PSOL-1]